MWRFVLVVLCVALTAAMPSQSLLEVESGLLFPSPLDRRVCSDDIIQKILTASQTEDGIAAGCNTVVSLVFDGSRPKYDQMCDCSKVLDFALANLYDSVYDCVVREGIWNVKEVSDNCRNTELARQAGSSNSTSVLMGDNICIQGETCINGQCVNGVCKCEEGRGGLHWEPIHPLWIGDDCRKPWCPNDCSGHGQCNIAIGVCVCDSIFMGDSCDVPHHETQITQGLILSKISEAGDISFSATEASDNVIPDPSLSPSPSPSPSLGSQFQAVPIAPRYTDPCAYVLCGPNGYCDANVTPVLCVCIGGFTGENCQIPPESPLSG